MKIRLRIYLDWCCFIHAYLKIQYYLPTCLRDLVTIRRATLYMWVIYQTFLFKQLNSYYREFFQKETLFISYSQLNCEELIMILFYFVINIIWSYIGPKKYVFSLREDYKILVDILYIREWELVYGGE